MASAPIFDEDRWTKLTAPLAGASPIGPDPRTDKGLETEFYDISDARAAAVDAEGRIRKGQEPGLDVAKTWREIQTKAEKFLAHRSKDFGVSVYLMESLVRLDGFAGLRDGCRLNAALLDRFGDDWKARLPDEETPADIVRGLSGPLGAGKAEPLLRSPLLALPLGDGENSPPPTWAAYLDASRSQLVKSGEARAAIKSLGTIETEIRAASAKFINDLRDDLAGAIGAVAGLEQSLAGICKGMEQRPSCEKILKLLREIRGGIVALVGEAVPTAPPATADNLEGESIVAESIVAETGAVTPVSSAPRGHFTDRDDAFRHLQLVADYFRRTDPQSLVAPAIEDVIRRGRMPWDELLSELLPDERARTALLLAAGIKWSPKPGGGN